jgi:hypothetical protein
MVQAAWKQHLPLHRSWAGSITGNSNSPATKGKMIQSGLTKQVQLIYCTISPCLPESTPSSWFPLWFRLEDGILRSGKLRIWHLRQHSPVRAQNHRRPKSPTRKSVSIRASQTRIWLNPHDGWWLLMINVMNLGSNKQPILIGMMDDIPIVYGWYYIYIVYRDKR